MKTEDLIKMLSTNTLPARRREFGGAVLISLGIGAAIALCFECGMFGTGLAGLSGDQPGLQIGVIALTLTLVVAGSRLLFVTGRPGRRGPGTLLLIGAVFLMTILAGAVGVVAEQGPTWRGMLAGEPLANCLICAPIIAIPTLVALLWALRSGAPVNPTLSGAAAGLVGGAMAMTALALHQPAGSLLGAAVLYGAPILVCTLIGAAIGWRLLRW